MQWIKSGKPIFKLELKSIVRFYFKSFVGNSIKSRTQTLTQDTKITKGQKIPKIIKVTEIRQIAKIRKEVTKKSQNLQNHLIIITHHTHQSTTRHPKSRAMIAIHATTAMERQTMLPISTLLQSTPTNKTGSMS